ncbi:endonuclease/exonuclease/phosphatase family protein [Singulisphaera sp. PoT]|uniref:endonuclease/exonuclease/phosphatase family protein n=1 Tax=Singulisphaera sp. PoT TaxID=3411797 RepID=UPI003BF4A23C
MEVEQEVSPEWIDSIPASRRPRWRVGLEFVAVASALLHPLATALGRYYWWIDLFTHFQVAAVFASGLAASLVFRSRPRLAIALMGLVAFQVLPILRYQGRNPVPAASRSTSRLRILMANVLCENQNFEALARLIRREKPDIVGLVEYDRGWELGLEELRREFPYHLDVPDGARGLALWFRKEPISIGPVQVPLPGGWPCMRATFEIDGKPTHLWLIHPSSPFHRRGRPELSALAEKVRAEGGSQVVIGDMNSTEGSPRFADFLQITGLRDSRLGFGRQLSWPVGLPYQIAIDHAFLSADLAVVDRRLGPSIGSDHAPLILDLAPAAGTDGMEPFTNSASPSKSN